MTLPVSGQMSLSMIQGEFGGENPISLSEYYGVASGIPTEGEIKLSDFYGASAGGSTPWCSFTMTNEQRRRTSTSIAGEYGYATFAEINSNTALSMISSSSPEGTSPRVVVVEHFDDAAPIMYEFPSPSGEDSEWGCCSVGKGDNTGFVFWTIGYTAKWACPFVWNPSTKELTFGTPLDFNPAMDEGNVEQVGHLVDDTYFSVGLYRSGNSNTLLLAAFTLTPDGVLTAGGATLRFPLSYDNSTASIVGMLSPTRLAFGASGTTRVVEVSGTTLTLGGSVANNNNTVARSIVIKTPSDAMPDKFLLIILNTGQTISGYHKYLLYNIVEGVPVQLGSVVTGVGGSLSSKIVLLSSAFGRDGQCVINLQTGYDSGDYIYQMGKINIPDTGPESVTVKYDGNDTLIGGSCWVINNNKYIGNSNCAADVSNCFVEDIAPPSS